MHVEQDFSETIRRSQQRIQLLMDKDNLSNREMRRLNRLIYKEARATQPPVSLELMPFNMEVGDSARLRSREYWDENRSVPLTADELESFKEAMPDSTDRDAGSRDHGVFRKIILGSQYQLAGSWNLQHGGLIGMSSYEFNTVDGFRLPQSFSLNHRPVHGKWFSISNTTAYTHSPENAGCQRFLSAMITTLSGVQP
jgi:hypothetical protein